MWLSDWVREFAWWDWERERKRKRREDLELCCLKRKDVAWQGQLLVDNKTCWEVNIMLWVKTLGKLELLLSIIESTRDWLITIQISTDKTSFELLRTIKISVWLSMCFILCKTGSWPEQSMENNIFPRNATWRSSEIVHWRTLWCLLGIIIYRVLNLIEAYLFC